MPVKPKDPKSFGTNENKKDKKKIPQQGKIKKNGKETDRKD